MASAAQIAANRSNSRPSTGPRTPEGKAAVAQNRLAHGLASSSITVLDHEDPAAYAALLDSIRAEYLPSTSTEDFLVTEVARSQWKLQRIAGIEHELLSTLPDTRQSADVAASAAFPPAASPDACEDAGWPSPTTAGPHLTSNNPGLPALAAWFIEDCGADQTLLKLTRYESTARRACYKALGELRRLRTERSLANARDTRTAIAARNDGLEAEAEAYLALPPGGLRNPEKAFARFGDPLLTAFERTMPDRNASTNDAGRPQVQPPESKPPAAESASTPTPHSPFHNSNPIPHPAEAAHTAAAEAPAPTPHHQSNISNPIPRQAPASKAAASETNSQPLENRNPKPMPPHLQQELARHQRRDPYFHLQHDRSQMSRELQRWFEKNSYDATA